MKLRVGREIEDSKLLKKRKSLELNLVCHSGTNLFKKIEDLNRELSPFNRRLDFSFFWRDFEAAIAEQLEYFCEHAHKRPDEEFLKDFADCYPTLLSFLRKLSIFIRIFGE